MPKRKHMPKTDRKKAAAAKKRLRTEFSRVRKKLLRLEKEVKKHIEKEPAKAAIIVAGIGAAIGIGITKSVLKHLRKRR